MNKFFYVVEDKEIQLEAGSRETADRKFEKLVRENRIRCEKYKLYQMKTNRFGWESKSFVGEFTRWA